MIDFTNVNATNHSKVESNIKCPPIKEGIAYKSQMDSNSFLPTNCSGL